MEYTKLKNTNLNVSKVALGCMRLTNLDKKAAATLMDTALDLGINFFDHADIYAAGQAESFFGEVFKMSDDRREDIFIQSKCGMIVDPERVKHLDFSYSHIIASAKNSLQRLGTDYHDLFLLHRPDTLMEPDEVAEAFQYLHDTGLVRYFGVSNMNPGQLALLQKATEQRLVVNQVQFGLGYKRLIDSGLAMNTDADQGLNRDGGLIEYCRLSDIALQAWSPFQKGLFGGTFLGDTENFAALNEGLDRLAEQYAVTNTAVATAWILRHPAFAQVICGSTNPLHLEDCAAGADLRLSREEWYDLYQRAGGLIP